MRVESALAYYMTTMILCNTCTYLIAPPTKSTIISHTVERSHISRNEVYKEFELNFNLQPLKRFIKISAIYGGAFTQIIRYR